MNPTDSMIVLRADAGPKMGTGHVMRVLTLAEGWIRRGGKALLLSDQLPQGLEQRAMSMGVDCVSLDADPGSQADALRTAEIVSENEGKWLVLDGYHLGVLVSDHGGLFSIPILGVDDFNLGRMNGADLILDQNGAATSEMYSGATASTELLLGGRFSLIRSEFHQAARNTEEDSEIESSMLITFGGADPANMTTRAINAMNRVGGNLCLQVVMGASNPFKDEVQEAAEQSKHRVELLECVSNIGELMAQATLAIGTPSVTCWELAFMKVPMVLVSIADNQVPNGNFIGECGAGSYLGWHEELTQDVFADTIQSLLSDTDALDAMSVKGGDLVDGRGVERVCRYMRSRLYSFRSATMDDARRLLEWANDPLVRQVSFSSEEISWESHCSWLERRLNQCDRLTWIAEDEKGHAVGQVRFDGLTDQSVISISLSPDVRGQGLGDVLIWSACKKLFNETEIGSIEALIKPDNKASVRVFEKSGFVSIGRTEVKGQPALRFLLSREQIY